MINIQFTKSTISLWDTLYYKIFPNNSEQELQYFSDQTLDIVYQKNAQICHKSRQSFPQQKLEKHNINSQNFIPMEFIFFYLNFFIFFSLPPLKIQQAT